MPGCYQNSNIVVHVPGIYFIYILANCLLYIFLFLPFANCIARKYTPIILFSYFKFSFQYNTWMCVLVVCIIMTEGYGFIIVKDCKNVNMNQKSLRIVLVSVVFFLVDIMLHVLPIKRILYKLFVVIYFKDRLNNKVNKYHNQPLHTNARFGFPFRAHYSGVYMGANTQFCQVSDSDSSRLKSHFLCLDSSP